MCENELWCPECGLKAGKHVLRRCRQTRGSSVRLKPTIGFSIIPLVDYNQF